MTGNPIPTHNAVAAIRRFNRFYTRQLGLLDETLLKTGFNLAEARVLYELAHQQYPLNPTRLSHELLIDQGYLSRILKSFEARRFLMRFQSPDDGRQTLLTLTNDGRKEFEPLNQASQAEVTNLISRLSPAEITQLVQSMQTIERLLDRQNNPQPSFVFRRHETSDLAWIAHRQAVLYTQEYGWDETYETLAGEILAAFVKTYDPDWERSWIAIRNDEIVGSVFVTRGSDTVAKLRLLYVEPIARGIGLGHHLVNACIEFARERGYRTLTLWTNDVLKPARHIYQTAGFTCVDAKPHHSFGKDLVGETWELKL